MSYLKNKKNNQGFLVLTMVLLVCAAVLIIATGSLLRSISQTNESADSENSLKAWSTVNACGEYALGQLASNWTYSDDGSLNVGSETCYYTLADSGTSKLIKASSTVAGFTKKILIEVTTNTPKVVINSWTEVADF